MNTYLFCWNPNKWEWSERTKFISNLPNIKPIQSWKTNRKKNIGIGDRFVLVKLGINQDKGIIGIGNIISEVYQDIDWVRKQSESKNFLNLEFSVLSENPLIELDFLKSHYPSINWTPEGNGNSINESIADEIFSKLLENTQTDQEIEIIEKQILADSTLNHTEKEQLIKARVGQGQFRRNLLKYWNNQCAVTGVRVPEILLASHIKPWVESDNIERLDVYNGLLLSPTLDKLFDKGYISFNNDGSILINDKIKHHISKLGLNKNMQITLHPNHFIYLNYHRKKYNFD